MQPSDEWTAALIEQRVAEMSEDEFAALIARTRPPTEAQSATGAR
jgi:hypothetical protein